MKKSAYTVLSKIAIPKYDTEMRWKQMTLSILVEFNIQNKFNKYAKAG